MIQSWVIYALISLVFYFILNLLFKLVAQENPLIVSLFLYGAATVAALLALIPIKTFTMVPRSIVLAIIIGICSMLGTIFGLKSIRLSPNPGYSVAIFSSGFVFITLVSVVFFGSSLSASKVTGIIATFIGLVLLSI